MPTIGFDIVSNTQGFTVGFAEADQVVKDLRNETKALEAETKGAFEKSSKEVNDYNKELTNGSKNTGKMLNEVNKLGKTKLAIQQLKAEIKFYTSEALKAGEGTKAFRENLEKAGKLKDQLGDLNAQLESLNGNIGENLAKAAGHTVGLISKGFEGVIALQVLAGEKNEEFEQTLLKLQSLNALASVAQEFAGISDKLNEIKLGFKPITDLYVRGNEAAKAFLKGNKQGLIDVGTESKSLSGKIADLSSAGIKSFKALWETIKANPLGVILTLGGLVIGLLVSLREKVKPIAAVFEFFEFVGETIVNTLEKIGQTLGIVASESEKRANRTIANVEREIAAIEARYRREIALSQAAGFSGVVWEKDKLEATLKTVNETIRLLEEKSKRERKLNKEDQEKYEKLIEQRKDLINGLAALQRQLEREEEERTRAQVSTNIALSESEYDRKIAIAKANNEFTLSLEKQKLDATKKFIDEELDRLVGRKQMNGFLSRVELEEREALLQKLAEAENAYSVSVINTQRMINEQRAKLQEDFLDKVREIAQQVQDIELEGLSAEDRIEKEKDLQIQELTALKASLIAKGQAQEDFEAKVENRQAKRFELTLEQEEQFNIISAQIYENATNQLLQLQADRQKESLDATKKGLDTSLELLEIQQENEENAVLAIRKPARVRQEAFETQQQIRLLQIKKKFAVESVGVKKAQIDAEAELQIQQIENEISILRARGDAASSEQADRLQRSIDDINARSKAQKDQIALSTAALVTDLDNQIDELVAKQGQFSLAKLLGISDQDLANIQSAIAEVGAAVSSLIQTQINAKERELEASQEKIGQHEQEIDSLENKIEKERQLAEDGKANNLRRLQEELALEQIARENALSEEKKLKKERQELAKQQLITDTLVQGSNLVVAASQIYATVAKDPITTAIATGTVAAMLISFGIQKAQAFKEVNEQEFATGVFDLQGPGTETSDSIRARLSAGETVFTAKKTRDNYDLFEGLFYDDQAQIDKALVEMLNSRGIVLAPDLPESLLSKRETIRQGETHNHYNSDNQPVTNELLSMNKKFEQLLKQNKTKIYTDAKGNLVKQIGSHTIVTRKNV
jgi:hypothetical protein